MKQWNRSMDLPEILFRLQNHISRDFKVLIRYFSFPSMANCQDTSIWEFQTLLTFSAWIFLLKPIEKRGSFFFHSGNWKEGRPLRRGLFEFAFAPRCLKLGFVVVILTLKVAEHLNVRQPRERLPFWKANRFWTQIWWVFFMAKIMGPKQEGSFPRDQKSKSVRLEPGGRLTWCDTPTSPVVFFNISLTATSWTAASTLNMDSKSQGIVEGDTTATSLKQE